MPNALELAHAAQQETGKTMRWYVYIEPDEAHLIEAWLDQMTVAGACLVDDKIAFFSNRNEVREFVKVCGGDTAGEHRDLKPFCTVPRRS